ncbi:PREDICTED: uncharacterized protein LOC105139749 [Populus euphratica]|uniref:Uncharacterized protein LOC105139749 n=1 Tax=Populus euphratica TaxID=75702 RepID=A0AAJ6Y6T1_POPEU|nr:PREDICTED: uncharacterized protein LOC105139749 [Populus euphratica]
MIRFFPSASLLQFATPDNAPLFNSTLSSRQKVGNLRLRSSENSQLGSSVEESVPFHELLIYVCTVLFSGTIVACFSGSRSSCHGLVLAGKAYIDASHISSVASSGSTHQYNWWSSTAFHHLPVSESVAPLDCTLDGSFLFAGGLSGNVCALSIPSGPVLKSCPCPQQTSILSHSQQLTVMKSEKTSLGNGLFLVNEVWYDSAKQVPSR